MIIKGLLLYNIVLTTIVLILLNWSNIVQRQMGDISPGLSIPRTIVQTEIM